MVNEVVPKALELFCIITSLHVVHNDYIRLLSLYDQVFEIEFGQSLCAGLEFLEDTRVLIILSFGLFI